MLKHKSRSARFQNLAMLFGIVLMVIAFTFLLDILFLRHRSQASNKSLLQSRQLSGGNQEGSATTLNASSEERRERRRLWYLERKMEPEYEDLSGWISIPLLNIETPLFMKEDDYWFYTEHNRFGEKTVEGEAGILKGNRNIIVWDHAFIDGTRFRKLANWPDNHEQDKPLQAWLEQPDGDIKLFELVEALYKTDGGFFQWDFPSLEHWHEYLADVVEWTEPVKPENLLTVYTCHTLDASIKSVLWFKEVGDPSDLTAVP